MYTVDVLYGEKKLEPISYTIGFIIKEETRFFFFTKYVKNYYIETEFSKITNIEVRKGYVGQEYIKDLKELREISI
mgnify:CR=1 FL=1